MGEPTQISLREEPLCARGSCTDGAAVPTKLLRKDDLFLVGHWVGRRQLQGRPRWPAAPHPGGHGDAGPSRRFAPVLDIPAASSNGSSTPCGGPAP